MASAKKYFTLINKVPVQKASGSPVIPNEDFCTLLDSKELLETVQQDAATYKKEISKELEAVKEQGFREGFEEGYKAWVEQVSYLEEEVKRVHDELIKLVMPISLKAAKKIVSKELETSPDTILSIVSNVLKSVAQHKKIVLYVNKNDFEIIESNKAQLKQLFEQLESFSIREREDVDQGGCVIETEVGIINAQIENRWRNLEVAFESLKDQLLKKE